MVSVMLRTASLPDLPCVQFLNSNAWALYTRKFDSVLRSLNDAVLKSAGYSDAGCTNMGVSEKPTSAGDEIYILDSLYTFQHHKDAANAQHSGQQPSYLRITLLRISPWLSFVICKVSEVAPPSLSRHQAPPRCLLDSTTPMLLSG